jgi:hypothetical protein
MPDPSTATASNHRALDADNGAGTVTGGSAEIRATRLARRAAFLKILTMFPRHHAALAP